MLGVSVYDLDAIAYRGGAGRKRELAVRRTQAQRIADPPGRVTEGIYLWWCESLGAGADRIVWLDVPLRVAVFRIMRWHIVQSLGASNPHPGVTNLAWFVWATRRHTWVPRSLGSTITMTVRSHAPRRRSG